MGLAEIIALLVSVLAATIRISTPLALSSIGEVISERSGIVNLGLEGQILTGAFAAVVGSYYTGSAYLGILMAVMSGCLLGLLHVLFVVKFKANQIVMGVAVNIFAQGLTTIGLVSIWGNRGKSASVTGLPAIHFDWLGKIPLIGPVLNDHTLIVYAMLAIAVVSWYVLFRTNIGLRLRAIGENPRAAASVGIKIEPLQYWAVSIGGALSGLAGSYLSLSDLNLFGRNMSAGAALLPWQPPFWAIGTRWAPLAAA